MEYRRRIPARLKLTADDVRMIRELARAGVPDAAIGKVFSVSRIQIWRIRKGLSRVGQRGKGTEND